MCGSLCICFRRRSRVYVCKSCYSSMLRCLCCDIIACWFTDDPLNLSVLIGGGELTNLESFGSSERSSTSVNVNRGVQPDTFRLRRLGVSSTQDSPKYQGYGTVTASGMWCMSWVRSIARYGHCIQAVGMSCLSSTFWY